MSNWKSYQPDPATIAADKAAADKAAADAANISAFCNDNSMNPWNISACIKFGTLLSVQKHTSLIVPDPTKPETVCGWGGKDRGGLDNIKWGLWGQDIKEATKTMAKHDPITWKPFHLANKSWGQRVACYFFNNKMLNDSNYTSSALIKNESAKGQSVTNWNNFIDNIKSDTKKDNIKFPSGWVDWITK